MRKSLAITSAKFVSKAGALFGKGGTALPGLVAERLDPDLLDKLAQNNFAKGIVVVTGTNGKTTTSKMIADIFDAQGISYVRNSAGSNLERGILATIIAQSDFGGRCKAEMAILEVDEAYIPIVCPALKPKMVVVTNLFRDQLDRYGELDSIAKSFTKTFAALGATLVLNADDPLVTSLGGEESTQCVYFGISDYNGEKIEHDNTADSIFDPVNGEKLHYLQRYFGHMGIYRSDSSDFKRPKPNIELVKMHKITKSESEYDVKTATEIQKVTLPVPGLYNIYNSLSAFSVGVVLKIDAKVIAGSLSQSKAAFGRGEVLSYGGKTIQIMLIKNPTGFNQVIQTFLKPKPQDNPLLICINDNLADGRDVSWLWDSAIEDLAGYKGKIVVSGSRAYDMALRLKYAGINTKTLVIEPNLSKALNIWSKSINKNTTGYILPTYTAMLGLRSVIARNSDEKVEEYS